VVKILFDTNVLIGVFLPEHRSHADCVVWLERAQIGEVEGYVGTHSLAELYSNLIKLPLKQKITPDLARNLITTNLDAFVKVSLDVVDYGAAIDRVTQYGLVSGAVFDALIAQAGLKVGVDRILTFNVRDFERLGDEVRGLIEVPGSPDMS
jgi:predicted nucleic acid-binding protein